MEPRIKPVEHPKGIFNRIMYASLTRQFGKVITPAKVIYARYPKIGLMVKKLHSVRDSLNKITSEETLLIQSLVATLNGCTFCIDISKRKALGKDMIMKKFSHLQDYGTVDLFSEREKAIFSFVEEMTKQLTISDENYDSLKIHCSDDEIIEITYIASAENFLNRMLKPLQIGSDELCAIR